MSSSGRATARVLLASVRADGWCRPSPELRAALAGEPDLSDLCDAAVFHGVAGYVRHALEAADAPDVARLVEPGYRLAVADHLRGLAAVERVAAALDPGGIPWLVVKGPVVAALAHDRGDLRGYGDVDVLVPPPRFGDALEALEAAGGEARVRGWGFHHRQRAGEVPVVFDDGAVVDLHWDLSNRPDLRRDFAIDTGGLFDRARPVAVGHREVRTLDPVDGLLHLAVHACTSGGNRLVWLKDVEGWLASQSPDPGEVLRRARRWRVTLPAAVVLSKVSTVLDADVDPDLVRRLAPGATWRVVTRAVWRVAPPAAALPGPSVDRLVMRSVRSDQRSSGGALVGKLRRILSPFPPASVDQVPPRGPADERDRGAYLAAVASGALGAGA